MTKQNINSKKGFTIIEVVLVLAIAGLIFLMVFVALPALQRSQRDTARRNDMARVSTSLVQYQTNNSTASSSLPVGESVYLPSLVAGQNQVDLGESYGDNTKAKEFIQRYMNSGTDSATNSFKDPDGSLYSLYITDSYADGTLSKVGSEWQQPGKGDVTVKLDSVTTQKGNTGYTVGSEFGDHIIYIIPGATCDEEAAVKAGNNNYAVLYRLEGAGVYCIDDQ